MIADAAPDGHASLRAGRRSSFLFGLLFALSAALTAVAVWLASLAPGSSVEFGRPLRTIFILLALNAFLILGLAALVGLRVLRLLRSRDVGAKLHLRFMTLFALAAVVPAVVVAFFFGVLVNQGVDNWFSTRIRVVVDNHAAVANALVQSQQVRLQNVIDAAATDLNAALGDKHTTPAAFAALVKRQAEGFQFRSVHVIRRNGEILAKAEPGGPAAFTLPTPEAFAEADGEDASITVSSREDLLRILFRLPAAPGVYALVAAPMPSGLLTRLNESEDAVAAYKEASANRDRVQAVFVSSYAETALLVLIGAIWLGMAAATAISEPVARLVKAANQVASGDLNVRVATGSRLEEIETLSKSFNRMTDDLSRQQTALRAAGLETEARRQFIETVLSGVSAGVLGLDPQMKISAANRQALRLLGLDEGQAIGASLEEAAPELFDVAERAALAGDDAEAEIDLLRGTEARRLRVRAGGDAKDGLVLTFDDITRLVAAQRNAAWKDVARRIAHEIKNPLTPIQLSAERLRRKYRKEITSDLETFDRCTDTIIRQVGDIGRMVDEFSAFARMPAPKFMACDGAELLRQAVFARRVAHPDIQLELEEDGGGEPLVCDDRMIGQALTNVLKNAAEAVEARAHGDPGFQGRITARIKDAGDNLVYEIEDNGVGLPAKDRARLTEPYVTTREKGTGLGLAIVKRIMEDHGGTLALRDSASGQGALVVLTISRGDAPAVASNPQAVQA